MCRFEAGQGYECMAELQEASRRSSNDSIRAWTKFIGAYLSHILRRPLAIYQLASQQVSLWCTVFSDACPYVCQPVSLSVCPSVRGKTEILLIRNCCNVELW